MTDRIDTIELQRKLGRVALKAADGGLRYVRADDLRRLGEILDAVEMQMDRPMTRTGDTGNTGNPNVQRVGASDALAALARIEAELPAGARSDDFNAVRGRLLAGGGE